MKKTFNFGCINYNGCGKNNLVTVDVEYREKKAGQKVFSASGLIWNRRKSDTLAGGQCLDEIAKHVNDPAFKEIYRLWKLYHLNDMHAECEHQHELGWHKQADEKITIYQWLLNRETSKEQKKIKEKALDELKDGKTVQLTAEEQNILSLEYSLNTFEEELSDNLKPYYKRGEDSGYFSYKETLLKGHTYESKHPQGILNKACPVCGYKYGSSWNYFPIPKEDEKKILSLFKDGK